MLKLGLIGFGYWGPNLLRNFSLNRHFQIVGIADSDASKLHSIKFDSNIKLSLYAEDLINDPEIDVIVIATPVSTHFNFASKALKRGKHVWIEKPMCTSSIECIELISIAKKYELTILVDHTFLMTPAVQKIHELCKNGLLGKICSYEATRVNLGLFQKDINVLWDLGPHDFSIINYLFNEEPIAIEATGYCHLNSNLQDMVYLTFHYRNMIAHFNMSWMSPVKIRRISIGGTQKMLVWDDLNPEEKIKIYSSGISYQRQEKRNVIIPEYRIGDIFSPRIDKTEALKNVVEHFAQVIKNNSKPLMDGYEGLKIVKLLEKTQKVLEKNSQKIHKLTKEQKCENVFS